MKRQKAESLSSSMLKRIFGNTDVLSSEALRDHQLLDRLESSGIVLVQFLHGLKVYFMIVFRCSKLNISFLSYFCLELDAVRNLGV